MPWCQSDHVTGFFPPDDGSLLVDKEVPSCPWKCAVSLSYGLAYRLITYSNTGIVASDLGKQSRVT